MTIRNFILIIILFSYWFSGFSQSKSSDLGYVYLASGDTISGKVFYKLGTSYNRVLSYSKDGNDGFSDIDIELITGFRTSNGIDYRVKEVDGKRAILELIYQCDLSLYKIQRIDFDRFFIEDATRGFTEILYKEKQGDNYVNLVAKYKGILAYYCDQNPNMIKYIREMRDLDRTTLEIFAVHYTKHLCTSNQPYFQSERLEDKLPNQPMRRSTLIALNAGLKISFKYPETTYPYSLYQAPKSKTWLNPFLSSELWVAPTKYVNGLYIKTGFEYGFGVSNESTTNNKGYFRVPLEVVYMFGQNKFQPFIGTHIFLPRHTVGTLMKLTDKWSLLLQAEASWYETDFYSQPLVFRNATLEFGIVRGGTFNRVRD